MSGAAIVADLAGLPPLRESLAAHGLLAKKSFGQHFLLTRKARDINPVDL